MAIELAKEHSENICVKIRDDNIASQGVAKKNGFIPTSATEPRNSPGGVQCYSENICYISKIKKRKNIRRQQYSCFKYVL